MIIFSVCADFFFKGINRLLFIEILEFKPLSKNQTKQYNSYACECVTDCDFALSAGMNNAMVAGLQSYHDRRQASIARCYICCLSIPGNNFQATSNITTCHTLSTVTPRNSVMYIEIIILQRFYVTFGCTFFGSALGFRPCSSRPPNKSDTCSSTDRAASRRYRGNGNSNVGLLRAGFIENRGMRQ